MSRINDLAKDSWPTSRIAVAGVSETRETPADLIYKTLRSRTTPSTPSTRTPTSSMAIPCYADVASLPEKPDGLVIVTKPAIAEDLVRQCVKAGLPRVWLHCMLGTRPHLFKDLAAKIGSVSPEALRLCRQNGIEVIPGSCPMQFLGGGLRAYLHAGVPADDGGAGGAGRGRTGWGFRLKTN
jgi:predicted CoA-binding protein